MADLQTSTDKGGKEEEEEEEEEGAFVSMEEDVAAQASAPAVREAQADSSSSGATMVVCVANCQEDPIISADHVEEKMQQLVHSHSFEQV